MHTVATSTILLLYARFFWAPFGSSKHFSSMPTVFFCHTKHLSAMLSPFLLCQSFFFHADHMFPLPSIFLLCWGLLNSSEHFSATLSTSRLFQSFLFYAETCFGSSKHLSAMLSIFSTLSSIFRLRWARFGSAKHFVALLDYVSRSRAHEIEIRPSSVRPPVASIISELYARIAFKF